MTWPRGGFRVGADGLTRDRRRFVVRGVNYHPSRTGTAMWRDFDLAEIERDFAAIAAAGFNTVRLFLYWRDIQPTPGDPSPEALRRVRECVDAAARAGLVCVVSLLTIWMNGERLDLPWRHGADLWRNAHMLTQQEHYVAAVARALAGSAGLLAFDLGDEVSNVAPDVAAGLTAAEVRAWYGRLCAAIHRGGGPGALVCQANNATAVFGDGAFSVANPGPLHLTAVHGFPSWSAGAIESSRSVKATHLVAFLAAVAGAYRPAFVDELGCYGTSEAVAAEYLAAATASTLANGALGVIAWCWQDLAYAGEPFDDRPMERRIGLHRVDGSPKPTMTALAAAFADADALHRRGRARIALYLPQRLAVAGGSYLDSGGAGLAAFYAYLLLKRAHLDFDVVAEDLTGYELAFCPSARHLTGTDLARLAELAHRGGTVFASLGDHLHGFPGAELTGVEPIDFTLLAAGRDRITWGEESWPLAWPAHLLPALRVTATGARVLAEFPDGSPALTEHTVGDGRFIFCPAPFELQIDGPDRLAGPPWHHLYARVAALAGVAPEVACADPDIEVVPLDRPGAGRVFVLNHRAAPARTRLVWADGRAATVALPAKRWRVLKRPRATTRSG